MIDLAMGSLGGFLSVSLFLLFKKINRRNWIKFCKDAEVKPFKTGVYGHNVVWRLVNKDGKTFEEWKDE